MAIQPSGKKTKDLIYRTARNQFYEKGYKKTTLKSISEASGENTALVSYYFKSKMNLALEVFNEYMAAVKVVSMYLLEKLTLNDDLMFVTAVEFRIQARNLQTSPEFLRFYNELNETGFFLKEQFVSVGFFENINRRYHLHLSKDEIMAVAVTNYAISASLQSAKAKGLIDCSNDFMVRATYKHFADLLGFDTTFTQSILEESKKAFEKTQIWIGQDFHVEYKDIEA